MQRHAIWLVLAILVGLAGAWVVLSLKPVAYTSTAAIDVEPRVITGSTLVIPNLVTEERVVTSGAILDKIAPTLGMSSVDLATHLSATVPGTSTILQIGCSMPTPAQAQNCASTVTQAYLGFRNQTAASAALQARDPLDVTLVSSANLPTSPAGGKKPELIAIGALLGLLIGVGAVYARDRADDRVRDRADLSLNLGAPALVEIPPAERKAGPAAFAFAKTPASKAAEAYRYLRIRIDALSPARDGGGYVVMVTGPRGAEGSTAVASNLATALAQGGANVLLADGDMRSASLSALYGKAGRPGLADLLTGMTYRAEIAQFTSVPRLALLPAGQSRGNPAELLEQEKLARVFALLSTTVDVVVVDSGPVLAVADPIALASASDVVVVVADVRRTTRADLRAVAREISSSGGRHMVGVLNSAPGGRASTPAPPAAPTAPPARQQGSPGAAAHVAVLPQAVNANNDGAAGRPDSQH
jgi:capsular exopolysaccharide synthesis family protein